ncbi:nucleoside 2-deoxyribosyltransferase [Pelagicoccus sp. SDUM812003]|uniref:nucleoside 2-deoxyribosyltransferase n=1 Tax=Pelagicoccus sp. SDUM812003 TaxID=3041267 RepID=UPI00280FD17A|nr:nucleoside 2-deoxyribosyltransferase [Pelagicoccus sp. SDUM812003]MDQ8205330.1 nucleoside 2-deoxyribosyltransferase [Pelagicoccus sp. SDUM812003]
MDTKNVYLAGCLFDLRHLAGNALLGQRIEERSEGRYAMYLPQDYEPPELDAKSIRDSDFEGLLGCDAAVFQFDGSELDSGTVAEFMAAKFADIPSVLLRTDFRRGGDRNAEPWNLMCSFYPRTSSLVVDAMSLYIKRDHRSIGGVKASELAIDELAQMTIEALDEAIAMDPVEVDFEADRKTALKRLLGM